MSAKMIVMFQCDRCNYTDSIKVEGDSMPLPNGWRVEFSVLLNRLALYCAGKPCSAPASRGTP